MVPELEVLKYEERLKEMQLSTFKERRERGELITIHMLMNNLEEINRKNVIFIRKRETANLRVTQEKLQKGICLNYTKK